MLTVTFPTVGLISSIAGHHIVESLKLKEIGAIISNKFMPTTVIHKRYPSPPVRIYAGKKKCGPKEGCDQIAVIMSEFMPPYNVIGPLVDAILEWSEQKKCRVITSFEGSHGKKEGNKEKNEIYGVGTTAYMQKILDKFKIPPMNEGMITGVTGVLLYKSALDQQNAMCLLSKTHSKFPDSRAAAKLIQILDVMIPGIKLDPKPLYEEAERIENKIKSFMNQSKPTTPQSGFPLNMYQ
ncbi:MAG: proteasome assembly chaperone family protein [Candidatus Thermoplasmatota archaeon]|nr:proteasome assembly chaperone family protein [Candidatus Thermoplasmatota archaeon]